MKPRGLAYRPVNWLQRAGFAHMVDGLHQADALSSAGLKRTLGAPCASGACKSGEIMAGEQRADYETVFTNAKAGTNIFGHRHRPGLTL